jgi:hypothetical protein
VTRDGEASLPSLQARLLLHDISLTGSCDFFLDSPPHLFRHSPVFRRCRIASIPWAGYPEAGEHRISEIYCHMRFFDVRTNTTEPGGMPDGIFSENVVNIEATKEMITIT